MYTLAKPVAVSRPTPSRFRSSRLRRVKLRDALGLVARQLVARGRVRDEVVVEQVGALLRRELDGAQLAQVAGAVEVEPAAERPRQALVDGDAAVLVGADEVRLRQSEERKGDEHGDEHEACERPGERSRPAAPPALWFCGPPRGRSERPARLPLGDSRGLEAGQ